MFSTQRILEYPHLNNYMLENRAQFVIAEGQTEAQSEVHKTEKEIGWITAEADSKDAIADIVIRDLSGVEKYRKNDVKFEEKRFGERIDLSLDHNGCIIELENIRNTKKIDIFVE